MERRPVEEQSPEPELTQRKERRPPLCTQGCFEVDDFVGMLPEAERTKVLKPHWPKSGYW